MTMLRIAASAFAIATAAATVAYAADPPPPVSAEPQNTSATYGDWILRCSKATDTAPRTCEVVQSFQVQGQQGVFALLAIGKIGAKDTLHVTYAMQPNISFPSTVKLLTDEKDTQPVELSWIKCIPGNGCFATADMKDDQIKRWKAQTGMGKLTFKDGFGRDVPIAFSFRGLVQALDGLAKS
jgi:invasion protein IalB